MSICFELAYFGVSDFAGGKSMSLSDGTVKFTIRREPVKSHIGIFFVDLEVCVEMGRYWDRAPFLILARVAGMSSFRVKCLEVNMLSVAD